jgi:hypothetical protein
MAQQTVVEWLIEELELDSNLYLIKDIVDKAKEMEKQQIIDTAKNSQYTDFWVNYEGYEDYYTQTYGK